MKLPGGWRRVHASGSSKTAAAYEHESGWQLRHCGHMTANWPFYATNPDFPGATIVTHNGLGFAGAEVGIEQIERVMRGELVATTSRCVPGIVRITRPEDDREWTTEESEHFASHTRGGAPRKRRRAA